MSVNTPCPTCYKIIGDNSKIIVKIEVRNGTMMTGIFSMLIICYREINNNIILRDTKILNCEVSVQYHIASSIK